MDGGKSGKHKKKHNIILFVWLMGEILIYFVAYWQYILVVSIMPISVCLCLDFYTSKRRREDCIDEMKKTRIVTRFRWRLAEGRVRKMQQMRVIRFQTFA